MQTTVCTVQRWLPLCPFLRVSSQRRIVRMCEILTASTAFRAPNPQEVPNFKFEDIDMWNPSRHIYSRYTQGVNTRVERVLSKINVGVPPMHRQFRANIHCRMVMLPRSRLALPLPMLLV